LQRALEEILPALGDFLETQMKHSTHYCFAKSPGGNLAGLADFLKSQMKHSTHYCFAKSLGGNLAVPGILSKHK
jgi:hypothetical protein